MKFLSKAYIYILVITVGLVFFNIFVRDKLINLIFNTSNEVSVSDADAYAKETFIRNIFVKLGFMSFAILFVSSVLLLLSNDKELKVNKLFVIIVLLATIALVYILSRLPNL